MRQYEQAIVHIGPNAFWLIRAVQAATWIQLRQLHHLRASNDRFHA